MRSRQRGCHRRPQYGKGTPRSFPYGENSGESRRGARTSRPPRRPSRREERKRGHPAPCRRGGMAGRRRLGKNTLQGPKSRRTVERGGGPRQGRTARSARLPGWRKSRTPSRGRGFSSPSRCLRRMWPVRSAPVRPRLRGLLRRLSQIHRPRPTVCRSRRPSTRCEAPRTPKNMRYSQDRRPYTAKKRKCLPARHQVAPFAVLGTPSCCSEFEVPRTSLMAGESGNLARPPIPEGFPAAGDGAVAEVGPSGYSCTKF